MKSIFPLALSLALCSPAFSALVYTADFSIAGQGFTHSTSSPPATAPPTQSAAGPNWVASYTSTPATDGSLNEFVTAGGVFRVQDFGGTGVLTSNTIAIPATGIVDIAGAAQTIGTDAFNNVGVEGITWFYAINAAAPVEVFLGETELGGPVAAGTNVGNTFSNIAVTNGDSLTVGFRVNVDGAGDGVEVSSLTVNHTAIPEPSSFAFLTVLAGLTLFVNRIRRFKTSF